VVNGASELFGEVFGRPVRTPAPRRCLELPLNAPVEVELIVEVR